MWRFIVVTFAFLGFALYELSGGADFEPRRPPETLAEAVMPETVPVVVPRIDDAPEDRLTLVAVDPALTDAPETRVDAVSAEAVPEIASPLDVRLELEIPPVTQFTPITRREAETEDPVELAVEAPTGPDLRTVSGLRVNMRNGPGTRYNIIARLASGDAVEVLQDPGNGWLKLKAMEDGRIGWISANLVSDAN